MTGPLGVEGEEEEAEEEEGEEEEDLLGVTAAFKSLRAPVSGHFP